MLGLFFVVTRATNRTLHATPETPKTKRRVRRFASPTEGFSCMILSRKKGLFI